MKFFYLILIYLAHGSLHAMEQYNEEVEIDLSSIEFNDRRLRNSPFNVIRILKKSYKRVQTLVNGTVRAQHWVGSKLMQALVQVYGPHRLAWRSGNDIKMSIVENDEEWELVEDYNE